MPTALAPPTPYAQTATAVAYAQLPIREPQNASCSRRRLRLTKTDFSDPPVSRKNDPIAPPLAPSTTATLSPNAPSPSPTHVPEQRQRKGRPALVPGSRALFTSASSRDRPAHGADLRVRYSALLCTGSH